MTLRGSAGWDASARPAGRRAGRAAALIRVDPDGSFAIVEDNVNFPNGVTCDGKTVVVAESFDNCLSAWDIEEDGSLSNRRERARFEVAPTSRDLSEVAPGLDSAA